jgi:hypothetical protein
LPSLRDKVSPEIKRRPIFQRREVQEVDEMKRMERREWMRAEREKLDRSHRDELARRKLESKEIDGPVRTRERLKGRLEKYAITPEDFDRLMAAQGYACGICRLPMESPQVDHDHHTGFVRGLLCVRCNMSIGQLGDTADALMRAVNYLQRAELKDPGRR